LTANPDPLVVAVSGGGGGGGGGGGPERVPHEHVEPVRMQARRSRSASSPRRRRLEEIPGRDVLLDDPLDRDSRAVVPRARCVAGVDVPGLHESHLVVVAATEGGKELDSSLLLRRIQMASKLLPMLRGRGRAPPRAAPGRRYRPAHIVPSPRHERGRVLQNKRSDRASRNRHRHRKGKNYSWVLAFVTSAGNDDPGCLAGISLDRYPGTRLGGCQLVVFNGATTTAPARTAFGTHSDMEKPVPISKSRREPVPPGDAGEYPCKGMNHRISFLLPVWVTIRSCQGERKAGRSWRRHPRPHRNRSVRCSDRSALSAHDLASG
jgi:hypothetical protein